MAEPLKFTFDTAFGTRSENDKLNQTVTVISQDEVDAARTQGFVQGREDGLAEASAQYNSEFTASFEQLSTKLDLLMSAQTQSAEHAMQHAQSFALLIAQKIAKTALNNYPMDQVKTLVDDCLSHVKLMPHLVIRVNDSLLEMTKSELQPIVDEKGYEGKLIILGEPDIALGDCMIEWADGGVAHNTQEIVQTISNILTEFFGFDAENVQADNVPTQPETNYKLAEDSQPNQQNVEDDIFANSGDNLADALEMNELEADYAPEEELQEADVMADDAEQDIAELELDNIELENIEVEEAKTNDLETSDVEIDDVAEDNLEVGNAETYSVEVGDVETDNDTPDNVELESAEMDDFQLEQPESDELELATAKDDFFDVITKPTAQPTAAQENNNQLNEQNADAETARLEGQIDE